MKRMKKLVIVSTAVMLLFILAITGSAESLTLQQRYSLRERNGITLEAAVPSYDEVMKGHEGAAYGEAPLFPVAVRNAAGLPMEKGLEGYESEALRWEENIDWVEFDFEVPADALYCLSVDYCLDRPQGKAVRTILVDGQAPFAEAVGVSFYSAWRNKTEKPIINSNGDQVASGQVPVIYWNRVMPRDAQAFTEEPLTFFLSAGKHTIRMQYEERPMLLGTVFLTPWERPSSYYNSPAKAELDKAPNVEASVIRQAEEGIVRKSDSTLRPVVNSDVTVTPRSVTAIRLNAIGDWPWREANQYITWEFEVPEDGAYQLGIRNIQWWNNGMASYRRIEIDGEVPYEEMLSYKFPYCRKWYTEVLTSKEGEPMYFNLKKGTHELTMTVTMGELAPIIKALLEDNTLISKIILQIAMIVGANPDVNYDYELDKKIPTLMSDLQLLRDRVHIQIDRVEAVAARNSALVNSLRLLDEQLRGMIDHPDSIVRRLDDLKNSLTALGDSYNQLQYQPILMDYFELEGKGQPFFVPSGTALDKMVGMAENLSYSFVKDYNSIGDLYDPEATPIVETIDVWVGRGKEWAETIKRMADADFTPKTGIALRMNVLPASQLSAGAVNALMLAISSDKPVDVALCVGNTSPVEFAIRNAVADLSQMPGFEKLEQEMVPGILTPFRYRGGVYGLPETMNFTMLFYRKDICAELGIEPPQTWEELYQYVIPALTRNNLNFYYGTGGYVTFLKQYGGGYYHGDGETSALDTPEAYASFRKYCDLFLGYGVPISANFYNRFRTGEMPMGVGGYNEYMQLITTAPELTGKWGVALLPGHMREDGTINRSYSGLAGEADIILSHSTKKEASWEFLKWWLSDEVQVQFAQEIEAIIGTTARWNTAKVKAFSELDWNAEDLKVILEMLQWGTDEPNVLGGYFTSRHINNAWNRVVVNGENLRDSLEAAVRDINKELLAKQEEYALVVGEEGK